jgi:hypothetical protein
MTLRSPRNTAVEQNVRTRMDGSLGATNDPEERFRARVAKVTAYEKYKAQLNEVFDGRRELPQQLKEMLSTRPGAEEFGFVPDTGETDAGDDATKKKRRRNKKKVGPEPGVRRRVAGGQAESANLVDALRKASSPRETAVAIDTMRDDGMSLPLDVELLSKALSHHDEDVIAEALRGLTTLIEGPQTKGASLLKGRLANVALMASSSEVRGLCSDLQVALSG